jgi:polar amino acid transport system substrate-binding protein
MRKSNIFLFVFIVFVQLTIKGHPQDITIYSHELKPFTWEENGIIKGLVYDLISETMKKMNVNSKIQLLPFDRALLSVQNGDNKAIFHVQRTPARENTLKWVGPIISNNVYIYCYKNSIDKIDSLDGLRSLKYFPVVRGEATEEYLTKLGFVNLFQVRRQDQCLKMLSDGKVEAAAFGELVVSAYARDANIDLSLIERTNIKLFDSVLYMGFSKNVPDETINKWQKALEEVKRSRYDALYKKYILNP